MAIYLRHTNWLSTFFFFICELCYYIKISSIFLFRCICSKDILPALMVVACARYSGITDSISLLLELGSLACFLLASCALVNCLLEKTLECLLDCKEIQPVHPKGDQSWVFIGRTDTEAETPILWLLDAKNWLLGKDPDAGKDWRQEEKGMTEDEIVGWHHWVSGQEFEETPGVGGGQGGLACCGP